MPPHLQFGDYTLDQSGYRLQRGDRRVRLEKIPMDLLILLARRQGELVSREEIAERLWGKDVFVDVEHGINTAIRKIRRALRDDPEKPRFIETVMGRGYRFAASVTCSSYDSRVQEAPHPSSLKPSLVTAAGPAKAGFLLLRPRFLLGTTAVLALLAMGFLLNRSRNARAATQPAIKSLAVLPLKNLSGDPGQEYFADGMTEELIGRLCDIHGLRVISGTSTMRFKETQRSVPEIARALHVDAVLEGAVINDGNLVRVHAQLIRGATGEHIWAQEYQREYRGLLEIQEEVAQSIARQVRATLTPQEKQGPASARALDPEAHEAYLKGRYYSNQRTETALKRSIVYYQQAIARDPDYALPYSGLADTYALLGYRGHVLSKDALSQAKTAALKAVQLNDNLAEAHASLAFIAETLEWDWPTAEREYKRALELNPGYARTHHWYAGYLMYMGRFDEGIAEERRAAELDPLSLPINNAVAGRLLLAGHYDEALAKLRETLDMDPHFAPAHNRLGWAYLGKGQHEDAIREFRTAVELSGSGDPDFLLDLGFAYAVLGNRKEATKILTTLKQQHQHGLVPSGSLGVLYGALGEPDQAFGWLEKAYAEHDPELTYIKVGPRYAPLRNDARFNELVHRIGLPR